MSMRVAGSRPPLTPLALAGVAVTRVLVPLWVLGGAMFKLFEGSPVNLPVVVLRVVASLDLDPMLVLRYAIGFELAVIGVIWLVPRLARPLAAAILILFLLVLVGDLSLGASSCGCFGAVRVHPAVTFIIDLLLLIGVLALGARAPEARVHAIPVAQAAAAVAWMVAAFAAAFAASMVRPAGAVIPPEDEVVVVAAAPTPVGDLTPAASDPTPLDSPGATSTEAAEAAPELTPTPAPSPTPRPAAAPPYYLPQYDSWVGSRWENLDMAAWVRGRVDAGPGVRYVMFYRKDCPHCHELMELHFTGAPPQPTTLIAVPERTGWPAERIDIPCTGCGAAELPPSDWLLATPVLVRLEDGVVACAAEVDPVSPECLLP